MAYASMISYDNKILFVEVAVAMESETLKEIIEAKGVNEHILLPQQVSGAILAKVMEYCRYHVESRKTSEDKPATPDDEIKAWDADFVKVDAGTFSDLILAAKVLKIKNLVDLACQTLADAIKGKTHERIQVVAESYLTQEEAAEFVRQWESKKEIVTAKLVKEVLYS